LIRDAFVFKKTPDEIAAVLAPKVFGTVFLDEATQTEKLDFLVLFSSTTAVMGNVGQSDYAYANAFLDNFAARREKQRAAQKRFGKTLSINWTGWKEGGMRVDEQTEQLFAKRMGMVTMESEIGLEAFSKGLSLEQSQFMVIKGYRQKVRQVLGLDVAQPQQTEVSPKSAEEGGQLQEQLQQDLLTMIGAILKVNADDIDLSEDISSYGFDSISFTEFTNRLNEKYQLALMPAVFFEYTSIDSFSQYLCEEYKESVVDYYQDRFKPFSTQESTAARPDPIVEESQRKTQVDTNQADPKSEIPDLRTEAVLDKEIRPKENAVIHIPSAPNLFITGATGFLGAFILEGLLKRTEGHIHCLVRATDSHVGMQRIRDNLQKYGLWQDSYSQRITVLLGDLARSQLGLSDQTFQKLGKEMDVIYHNAAHLNFIYPYKGLKAVNVESTRDIIRLATLSQLKPIHHISSTCVFSSSYYTQKTVYEHESVDHIEGMKLGYCQSKWVAEQLVLEAGRRGVPVSVYRSSLVSGHSKTGVWNTNDFTCRLIKGCIQTKYAPDWDWQFDIAPVNYVTEAIVYLSTQTTSQGQNFHLVNPQRWHWREFIQWLPTFGYAVQIIPYNQWLDKIQQTQSTPDTPLHPLLPFLSTRPYDESKQPRIDSQATREMLAEGGIVCPAVDSALMETYFTAFVQQGFLPAP
jgi:thioester reductase-like protein